MRLKATSTDRLRLITRGMVFLGLGLAQVFAIAAEDAPPPEAVLQAPTPQNRIEEIEVIGQRSLIQLRLEIKQAEVHMFSLFNELNSKDEFDVNCRNVTHTGTLIPTWECDTGYIKEARFQNVQDFLDFGIPPTSEEELWWESRHKTAQLNAEMKEIAKQHPDLAVAMIGLHEKRQRLEDLERDKRAATKGFFARIFGKRKD